MADSGSYTPETIARRLEIAKAMMAEGQQPVKHWAQGLSNLANDFAGASIYKNAEQAEQKGQNASYAAIASLLGGGAPIGGAPATPDAGPAPSSPPPSPGGPTPSPMPPAPLSGPPVRQAMEGNIPVGGGIPDDPFRTRLDAMRPPQADIVSAFRGAAGLGPAASPVASASPPASPVPPAPVPGSGGAPAGPASSTPAATSPMVPQGPPQAPPAQPDIKAKIAAMLQDPNPYVRRQGATLAQQVIASTIKGEGTDNIKNFEYAKKNGFQGSFLDFVQQEKSRSGGKFGLQPIWGSDKDGNPVILQLSPSGEAAQTKLPEGVRPSTKNLMKVDTGTHINLVDPVTHQVVSSTPKNIVEKEAQEKIGEAKGTAIADLPRVMGNAQQTLDLIDKIQNHPGRVASTGPIAGRAPAIGGSQADFVSLMDQLKGKTFLEAFNSLRGGGAITEVEGAKATDALGRLSRVQTKEGFDDAMADLKAVIKRGVENAQKKAAMTATGAPAAVAAAVRRFNPDTGKFE